MKSQKQTYDNSNRQKKAEETKLEIIKALGNLWGQHSIIDITLEMVAEEAGVTTRTILRKFGSREGLMEASLAFDPAGISANRNEARVGDVDHILQTLLDNYEKIGEAALRTIFLESELEIARKIGARGRFIHKQWCERVFEPFLPDKDTAAYEIQLASFIATTEIYLWKLLRKDLKFSRKKTFSVFKNMVEGVIQNSVQNHKS